MMISTGDKIVTKTSIRPPHFFKLAAYISIVVWLAISPLFPPIALAKPLRHQVSPDDFGPEAVWDPYDADTPGGAEVRQCYFSGTDPLNCILPIMEASEAASQAIEFVEMTNGEAFMVQFEEKGTVDLAGVVYPGRANGNFQYMLLNSAQPMVRADNQDLQDTIRSSLQESSQLYLSLVRRFPDVSLWIWDNTFEGAQVAPTGGQRFIFSYLFRDGCHACDVVAHAFVAFTFDSEGRYEGASLVTLATPDDYERVRSRFQTDAESFDGQVGGISYIGEDGNLWVLAPRDDQLEQLTHVSEGRVIAYDWSPDREKVIYVKQLEDDKTEIHLLDLAARESELLLSNVDYYPFGGIAMSPSGEKVAFTRGFVDVEILDAHEKRSTTVFHADGIALGAGVPATKRGLSWSPDGEYLAVDMYATGSVLLSVGDTPEPERQFLFPERLSNPTWAPDGGRIAWVDWTEGREQLILTNRQGNNITSIGAGDCSFGPNASLSWAPSGDDVGVSTPDGICLIDVETGTATRLFSGQGTWNVRWSGDGQWILFRYVSGIGTMGVNEQTLGLVNADDGELVDLGFRGAMPAWVESFEGLTMSDIDAFLEKKETLIPKLEKTNVNSLGVSFSVAAYDEGAARDLVERIREAAEDGSVTPDQAEAFARATLHEQSLAGLLPVYVQTSSNISEVMTDGIAILLSAVSIANEVLRAQEAAGGPLSGAYSRLARMINRRAMRVIQSFGDVVLGYIPDAEQRRSYQTFWGLLVNGITLELEAGAADVVEDLLLGTVIKWPATRLLVSDYVRYTQPWLDQGIRSADPAYKGSEPTWVVEGDIERATIHAESLVDQAIIVAENAHRTHEDLMRGADIAELAEDIAAVGQLTPWAAIALAVNIGAKFEHVLVDSWALGVNIRSTRCTRYLSSRAGSLAFNPNQPGESCSDMSGHASSAPALARQVASKGDVVAWSKVARHVDDRSERYRQAVQELLVALREGRDGAIVDAVIALDEADQAVDLATRQATAVLVNSDVPESVLTGALSHSNQFSMDALELYLLVASYATAPDNEQPAIEDIEKAGSTVLSSLETYDDALAAAAPTADESGPLPIIRTVVLLDDATVNQPLEASIAVQNIGSADANEVLIRSRAMGQETQEMHVDSLTAGQIHTATVSFKAVQTGTVTLLTQVTMDGSTIDSRIDQVVIGPERADEIDKPQSGLCLGSVLPLLVVGILLFAAQKRNDGWPGTQG